MKEWVKILDFLNKNGKKTTTELTKGMNKSYNSVFSTLGVLRAMNLVKQTIIKVPGMAGTRKVSRRTAYWEIKSKIPPAKIEWIIKNEGFFNRNQEQTKPEGDTEWARG